MGWSSLHVVVYCCCKGPHLQAVELVQAKDRELAQARQQLKQTKVNSKSHMCCKSDDYNYVTAGRTAATQ